MSETLPVVYVARHGETAWSLSGQHTGLTYLPLTERGRAQRSAAGRSAQGTEFRGRVFTSPLQRATRTCELAGFGAAAEVDRDLLEWNYGEYEGRRTAEILAERPGWKNSRDGCPGGESPSKIGARADRVVSRLRAIHGDVLLVFQRPFSCARSALAGSGSNRRAVERLSLSTASLGTLAYEHSNLTEPVIRLWNDTRHVET